ncbi:MAG: glycosyltransferase [Flavobacteriales bacterium]
MGNEIKVLSRYFKNIHVFPLFADGAMREVPENVVVHSDFIDHKKEVFSVPLNAADKKLVRRVVLKELFGRKIFKRIKQMKAGYSFFKHKVKQWKYLLKVLERENLMECVHYSVWFNDWCTVLACGAYYGKLKHCVARAHGYDLFEWRRPEGFVPFISFHLTHISQVYTISKSGHQYLISQYPAYAKKIEVNYLGVFETGVNPVSDGVKRMVTASNINEVKQLHLLANALVQCKNPVEWIHFGDGPLREKIEAMTKNFPAQVRAVFKGRVDNSELLKFYAQTHVTAFINVSKSEGVPVSMMEATSYGIPVIATQVGGTEEIISAQNGILLSPSVSATELAEVIDTFDAHVLNQPASRQGIRETWKKKFEADKNYADFAKSIILNHTH